ncbi:hypothetical protein, partial [uncultured Campylobacter sp.]|uniref:hypothetical protein n=1 Tax=uncultured Campylobacter sp. TaxID=218934 RepID=UPI0026304FB6
MRHLNPCNVLKYKKFGAKFKTAIGSGAFLPRGLLILRRNLKRSFARFRGCEFCRSSATQDRWRMRGNYH